ncbi:MAG: hypothetical protein EOP52_09335 [Sphingobacteriales bacterium]|nr:MAG: hypothetical protein EOP52_09335 [Sphingobacteriales bacterium]
MNQFILTLLLALSAICTKAQEKANGFSGSTDTVFVSGLVQKPFNITPATVAKFALTAVPAQSLVNDKGEVRKTLGASSGLLLRDLIQYAGAEIPHKENGKYLVVVTAADGLQVVFAYNELLYGPAAKGAYLLVAAGVSGMEESGSFTVLCTTDQATTARYVKWVRSIELRKI